MRRCCLPVALVLLLISLCGGATEPLFESVTPEASGVRWVHENGMSESRLLPETTGAGCAFFDYNNDGWMDILLLNSGLSDFFQPGQPLHHALYKNNRDGTFTDVATKAGITGNIFGMGVAAGDYDNDGFTDVFLSGAGQSIVYRNAGNGTFTDATKSSGIVVPGWATSAAWFDFDADGHLDLFVGRYVDWRPEVQHACGSNQAGRRYYCTPQVFPAINSLLFRNNADGTFTEVGKDSVIGTLKGKALGVVATDVNNDGRMDLFVSNDTVRNFLFINRPADPGKVRWKESGTQAEVSYSEDGKERSGMGVDSSDFNADGRQDLFVSNIDHELFALYENRGDGSFIDRAKSEPLGRISRLLSGWGMKFFDFDNDSEIDIILANGHPNDMISKYSPAVTYRQPLRLLRRVAGHYQDASTDAGPAFAESYSARGLAVGDYDNDGRIDAIVQVNGGRPLLLHNRSGKANHWIGLKLQGFKANRDAAGAIIKWSVNGKIFSRLKTAGGSFLSSHDPRVVLGLSTETKVDWLEVQWPAPSGVVQRIQNPLVDRYISVVEVGTN